MMIEGIVVNGVIVLEGGTTLPEGLRVRIEVDDLDDPGPPPEPYDRDTELASFARRWTTPERGEPARSRR
jgi:hypothetical protein